MTSGRRPHDYWKFAMPLAARRVLALLLLCAGLLAALAGTAQAAAKATGGRAQIRAFTVTPNVLSAVGGTVHLSARLSGAVDCAFTATRGTPGRVSTRSCRTGAPSVSVEIPANRSVSPDLVTLRLVVIGADGRRLAKSLTIVERARHSGAARPRITAQPADQTAAAGASVTFRAAASGRPAPTVQWQVSTDHGRTWGNLPGADTPVYTALAAPGANGYEYRAWFTNAAGAVATAPAELTVASPTPSGPAPTAPTITSQPASQTVVAGSTVTFSAAASGTPDPAVQWQLSENGGVTWSSVPGDPATTISFTAATNESGWEYRAVFTNTTGSATTAPAVLTVTAPSQAPVIVQQPSPQSIASGTTASFTAGASGTPTPSVQWQLSTDSGNTWANISGATAATYAFVATTGESGYEYRAVFSNSAGSATTVAATLTISTALAPPAITVEPANQEVLGGASVSFDAAASGDPTPSVQWQASSDGGSTWQDLAGATSTTYTEVAQIGQNGLELRAVFTNTQGSATTAAATLTVVPEASSNWSGYVATGTSFTAVAASWIVPAATCAPGATSYSSEWVGIDGWSDTTVEQDGTETDCDNGTPDYSAWYEMYGDPSLNNGYEIQLSPSTYPVAAGDALSASTELVGSYWVFTIMDATSGWSFQTSVATPTPAPGQSSAEWIVERPTVNGEAAHLTDFGSVTFTVASATAAGQSGPISSFGWSPIEMFGGATPLALPGSLSQDGAGFTDTWQASG